MLGKRIINTKVAAAGCTDIVDNYDPFDGNGVALYQLNGDATDVSGNYDGTASNVTWGGAGQFGTSAAFNGSSSKISVTSTSTTPVNFTDKNFSISCWIKADNFSSQRCVFSKWSSTSTNRVILSYFNTDGTFSVLEGDGTNNNGSSAPLSSALSTNTWYHIVYVRDSNSGTIYINGTSDSYAPLTNNINNGSNDAFQLGMQESSSKPFDGSIDQVRIFNTALTPLEIEALYTEELCICDGTVDTLDILGDGSCIATYQLDGNANDLSGNYSGTPTDVSYGVGEFDLAGVFNGSTSRIDIAPPVQQQALSVSAWVNYTSADPYLNIWRFEVLPLDPPVGTALFLLTHPSDQIGVAMASSQTYRFNYIHPTTNLNDGQWHHVVFSWDGTTNTNAVKLYIDEVVATSTSTIPASSMAVYDTFNFARDWNGNLDQVRVFNKALNQAEVTTLYNETACTKVTRTAGATQILGDTSCIAYFKLDDNATDETGNYTTSVTEVDYGVGEFGQAGYFNQVYSSRIEANAAILPADIFSVSLWMKVTVLTNNKWILTQYTGGVTGRFVFAYSNNGKLQISNGNLNSGASITENIIRNNIWQHIVLIKNGGSGWEIYVDNQSIGTWSNTSNIITNQNTVFGGNQNVTDRSIDGQLDNIRIFNKAISPSEVTTLYNEGI